MRNENIPRPQFRLSALSQLPNIQATEKNNGARLVRATRIASTVCNFKWLHLHLGNLQQMIAGSINTAALSHLYQERPSENAVFFCV